MYVQVIELHILIIIILKLAHSVEAWTLQMDRSLSVAVVFVDNHTVGT